MSERLPDFEALAFWEWAVLHKAANACQLARWFPEGSRASWEHRCKVASRKHGVKMMPANRATFSDYPKDPPDGWPSRDPQQCSIDPGSVIPDKKREAEYKESVEILSDGGYRSNRLLTMSAEQCKDKLFLLEAHGFDPAEWEIVTAKNNIWNVYSKGEDGHDISTLYSSKLTVRPLTATLDIEAIAEAVRQVEPVRVKQPKKGKRLLELGHVDMHFGNSTFAWYLPSLERTVAHIAAHTRAEVLIPIGSDLFDVDNFKNSTSNGTIQSSVDWPEAWGDALRYYSTLIETALAHAVKVYGKYIIGNHDESMAWAFCQMLAAKYPQLEWDLAIEERKVHTFGRVSIGMTHGDGRTRKDLDRVFMSEFPAFAQGLVREVHAGHYHHEVTVDQFGVVTRSLSTAARTDKWHREEGYVGACKRFMLFEYEPEALTGIHYV